MTQPRWTRWPEGSTWGDFGADDTWERLNLLGLDQVRKGVAEVWDGRTFCLSLPLDHPDGMVYSRTGIRCATWLRPPAWCRARGAGWCSRLTARSRRYWGW
jgi:hypothetical protein